LRKFHNTIIFGTSDTILAQLFLGIQQNQCFTVFQRRRLCDDVFSTLADEFGDFWAVFGTAPKERYQIIGFKKHGGISAYRKAFLLFWRWIFNEKTEEIWSWLFFTAWFSWILKFIIKLNNAFTSSTDYVDSIPSLGYISLINKPTRFSSTHQPSLLDHIYTNMIDDNTTTGIALYDISDHLPVFANFNFHPKCAKKYRPKIPCLKNVVNLPSFLEDLNTAFFDLDFHNQNDSDINITCNNFILMFNNILDQHAPLRFASRKETRSFHKPWLTKGLLTSISKKNALYKTMLSTNNPSISAKYKFYRNKITHLKESLKQNYYRSKFENCRNDVKNLECY